MNQLDQVTQKNVAMFEETMAATQTVTAEANTLVGVTGRFQCNRIAPVAPAPAEEVAPSPTGKEHEPTVTTEAAAEAVSKHPRTDRAARKPVAASISGNLALSKTELPGSAASSHTTLSVPTTRTLSCA